MTAAPRGEEMLAALGAKALAAFRADPDRFDLDLTDEIMPEMTGTSWQRRCTKAGQSEAASLLLSTIGPRSRPSLMPIGRGSHAGVGSVEGHVAASIQQEAGEWGARAGARCRSPGHGRRESRNRGGDGAGVSDGERQALANPC